MKALADCVRLGLAMLLVALGAHLHAAPAPAGPLSGQGKAKKKAP